MSDQNLDLEGGECVPQKCILQVCTYIVQIMLQTKFKGNLNSFPRLCQQNNSKHIIFFLERVIYDCLYLLYIVRSACKLRARRTEYKSVFFHTT